MDTLDNAKVDLSIQIPLTERAIVKKQDDGTLTVTYADEPPSESRYPAKHWTVFANDEKLIRFDAAGP